MGNTNEANNSRTEHLESYSNNINTREIGTSKSGFFQSMLCCGQSGNINEVGDKNDFLNLEYYWYYQSDYKLGNSTQINIPWVPYSIELNNIIEKAYQKKRQFCKFNFPENKYIEYMIDFQEMTQSEIQNKRSNNFNISDNKLNQSSNSILKVRRLHKDEEKLIIRKSHLENTNFLDNFKFINDYNNTHNIQNSIKISSFFNFLSFPIKCLEIFNQEIYLPPETISILKNYLSDLNINSFPHLKQLLTQEISNEAEKLNNKLNRKGLIVDYSSRDSNNISNYLLQAEIYNNIIELKMNQDNLEEIIIYIFNLEGFVFERIIYCLRNKSIEDTSLKLFLILIQACICRQGNNDAFSFIKSNSLFCEGINKTKHLKLYKGCFLDNDMLQKYSNMLKPLEHKPIEEINSGKGEDSIEEQIESETLFKRVETLESEIIASESKKPLSIKASLENILNDFKKQIRNNEIKENHFCMLNEFLLLNYNFNSLLENSLQNNVVCIFKFDSSLFSSLNSTQILYFIENLNLFGSERVAIVSPFSVFKLDCIEKKLIGASAREIYEINFSYISNGNKKYDYLNFVNHMKFDLHSKNLSIEEIKTISNALKINTNVLALNLHGNKLGAESCKILGEGIVHSKTLKLLSLSNCCIDTIGIEYISNALKNNNKIEVIWLNNNNFGSKGIKYLMDMLRMNEKIESIWLENNSIGYEGGVYISEMLANNQTLKYIYLRNNELGPQGVKVISEAIKINKTLEGIHLSYNSFGPLGAEYISEALKVNLIIKEISINGNKIEKKGADCIADLLEINKKIFVGKVDY